MTAPGCSPSGAAEVDGELRIVADPPLIVPIEDLTVSGTGWEEPAPLIKELLARYRRTLGAQGHPLEEFRSRCPAKWSAWAALAPAATSCCSLAETKVIPYFCKSRRHRSRYWNATSGPSA